MSLIKVKRKTDEKKPTRFYSNKQERKVAKTLGGKQQPNSGATPFQKGDLKTDNFLIECKTVTKDKESFSIKKEWLEKNAREALFVGKPANALAFNFGPDQPNYYIIDEELFQLLLDNFEEIRHHEQ